MGIPLREPIQTWCICHGLSPQLIPYTVHQVCRRFVWVTSEAVFLFRHKKNSSNKAGDSKIPSRFFFVCQRYLWIFVWKHTEKHSDPRDTQQTRSNSRELCRGEGIRFAQQQSLRRRSGPWLVGCCVFGENDPKPMGFGTIFQTNLFSELGWRYPNLVTGVFETAHQWFGCF